ncbi:hypothetical protein ABEB36_015313 [Hypothenemus hampei]|uniref:THAP-type domain-containing protein n=1 Tax=Hypothenemus hampei TaxID=57062 RepID=A0ABD1DZT2_HYPHA
MGLKCTICGCDEQEVSKLHYFPRNPIRSKLWQKSLGIKVTECSLRNLRICSRHFTSEMYINMIDHKLSRSAIPILYVSSGNSDKMISVPLEVETPVETSLHVPCLQSTSSTLGKIALFLLHHLSIFLASCKFVIRY